MIYSRNSNVVKRDVAGESFLIPVKNNLADMDKVYVLHGIGSFIWEMLDGDKDMDAVCDGIVSEYDIDAEQAMIDLQTIISDFKRANLISEAS